MRYYKPQAHNHAHIILPVLLLLISAASLAGATWAYLPWLIRFIGIATLAAALLLVARYSLSPRRYTLTDPTPDFPYGTFAMAVVGGAFVRTLATVSLADALELVPHKRRRTYGKHVRVVDGRQSLLPDAAYDLVGQTDGKMWVLILEADAHFASVLVGYLPEKKQENTELPRK